MLSFIGAIEGALQGWIAMPNLLPFQKELLSTELVSPQADKGLGTCAVEIEKYINDISVTKMPTDREGNL
jgi:hypothetical protein